MGSSIFNDFHKTWFISFDVDQRTGVRLSDDLQQRGSFVIYGTQDNVCSIRETGERYCV